MNSITTKGFVISTGHLVVPVHELSKIRKILLIIQRYVIRDAKRQYIDSVKVKIDIRLGRCQTTT